MNKFRTFFTSLFKSSVQPTYGNDIVKASGSFSFKFFVVFTLLTALITTGVMVMPLSQISLAKIGDEVSLLYPADLAITVDPAEGLHINQPLPYTIYVPEATEPGMPARPTAFVTFASESADLTFEKIASFESPLVVTDQNIYARRSETGRFEVTPIPDFEQRMTFDKDTLNKGIAAFLNHPFVSNKWYVPAFAVIAFGFVLPFMLIGRGLTAVLYAVVTWIVGMIFMKSKNVSYGKVLQLSLHTLTPVVILAYVFDFAGHTFFHGWIYFFAYFVWTLVMISQLGSTAANSAPVVTTPTPARSSSTAKKASAATHKRKVASKR